MWTIILIIIIVFVVVAAISVSKELKKSGGSENSNKVKRLNEIESQKPIKEFIGTQEKSPIDLIKKGNDTLVNKDDSLYTIKKVKNTGFNDYTKNERATRHVEHIASGSASSDVQNMDSDFNQFSNVNAYVSWAKKYQFDISGESFYQNKIQEIAGYKQKEAKKVDCISILEMEPSNTHDSNAVAVKINNTIVGYLSKKDNKTYIRKIKSLGLNELDRVAVRARIVGGWRNEYSEGGFGVKLDLPEFSRFEYCFSKISFDDADLLLKSNPISDEQREFFDVLGLSVPDNINYFNFARYRNKKLKEFQQSNLELWDRWQEHIATPDYSQDDVYDFWNDKDERDSFDIKKPNKSELKGVMEILIDRGYSYQQMVDDPDIVYEELIKLNPELQK